MYTLYHHGSSVCAGKVRLALAEKNLKWDGVYIDILKGDQFAPDYMKLNPKAVVPTLVDGENVINESTVIIEYLDLTQPEVKLHPRDPYEYYQARLWTKAVDEELHPACAAMTFMSSHRHTIARLGPKGLENFLSSTPQQSVTSEWKEKKRLYVTKGFEAPDGPAKVKLYDRYLHKMEDALKDSDWLVGDSYGIADLSVTPYVNRLAMMSMSGMWENGRLPSVTEWWDRIRARPAFQTEMLDWVPEQLTEDLKTNGAKSWPDVAKIMALQRNLDRQPGAQQDQTMTPIDISPDNLLPNWVAPGKARHEGSDALRLVLTPDAQTPDNPTFARLKDLQFHNGVIEVEVAGRPLPDAPPQARGFIGIAFRIQDDLSAFECIYIRPTNGRAEVQLRRNRATQYFSYPDWKFDRLRTEVPGHYEAYVDLITGAWTHLRIEVEGQIAKLFVHGQEQPTLIVNDLKHGPALNGGIGLYIDSGTEGFFRNLQIAHMP